MVTSVHRSILGTMSDTTEISVRELRKALAGTLNDVAVRGRILYITNNGRRVAALVPVPVAEQSEQARG
jgi:prevent-host-death family protein